MKGNGRKEATKFIVSTLESDSSNASAAVTTTRYEKNDDQYGEAEEEDENKRTAKAKKALELASRYHITRVIVKPVLDRVPEKEARPMRWQRFKEQNPSLCKILKLDRSA